MSQDQTLRVLIASTPELRLLDILDLFGERGWICIYVRSEERALELVKEGGVDVVLLDPELDHGLLPTTRPPVFMLGNDALGMLEKKVSKVPARTERKQTEQPAARPTRTSTAQNMGRGQQAKPHPGSAPPPSTRSQTQQAASKAAAAPAAKAAPPQTVAPHAGRTKTPPAGRTMTPPAGRTMTPPAGRTKTAPSTLSSPPPSHSSLARSRTEQPAAPRGGFQSSGRLSSVDGNEKGLRKGALAKVPVAVLLLDLAFERCSGVLRIQGGEVLRELAFREGALVAAASNIPGERLGALLVREGLLDSSQRQALNQSLEDDGASFTAEHLLDQRMLSQEKLEPALQTQLRDLLTHVLLQDEGEFIWVPECSVPDDRVQGLSDLVPLVAEQILESLSDGVVSNMLKAQASFFVRRTKLYAVRSRVLGERGAAWQIADGIDGRRRMYSLLESENVINDLRVILLLYLARAVGFCEQPDESEFPASTLPWGPVLSSRAGAGEKTASEPSARRAAGTSPLSRGALATPPHGRSLGARVSRSTRRETKTGQSLPASQPRQPTRPPARDKSSIPWPPGHAASDRRQRAPEQRSSTAAQAAAEAVHRSQQRPTSVAPFPMAPPPSDPRAAGLMAKARFAMQEGQLAEAAQYFEAVWNAAMNYAEAISLSGWCLLLASPDNEAQREEAFERLRLGTSFSDGEALPFLRMGLALLQVELPEKARIQFAAALKLDPKLEEARTAYKEVKALLAGQQKETASEKAKGSSVKSLFNKLLKRD